MRRATIAALFVGLSASVLAAQESTPQHRENSGQDPANPVRRLDLRLQYRQIDDGIDAWIFTLRLDAPFALGNGWRLGTRIDVPIIRNDVPSLDNLDGDYET